VLYNAFSSDVVWRDLRSHNLAVLRTCFVYRNCDACAKASFGTCGRAVNIRFLGAYDGNQVPWRFKVCN
jgi:hypothetical protein